MVGSSASAVDICRDLAGVAKEVHLVSRSVADGTYEKQPGFDNMWLHSMVKSVFMEWLTQELHGRSFLILMLGDGLI